MLRDPPTSAQTVAAVVDGRGRLHVTTSHLNHGFAGVMDFNKAEPNFRFFRLQADRGPAQPPN